MDYHSTLQVVGNIADQTSLNVKPLLVSPIWHDVEPLDDGTCNWKRLRKSMNRMAESKVERD